MGFRSILSRYRMWFILLFAALCIALIDKADPHHNDDEFIGKEHWDRSYISICDTDTYVLHENPENFCSRYVVDYNWVNVEVLSQNPILIQYHEFYAKHQAEGFRNIVDSAELEMMQVLKDHGGGEQVHTARRANGTWFEHYQDDFISNLYDFTRRRIPNINFHSAEMWHALSYQPGGHYAPHYDYIIYSKPEDYDYWMNTYGQRMATFLAILKTADEGGGTIFPRLFYAVKPKVGDVIFWFNQDVDGEQAEDSLHGACPIYGGRKVAATLWIRQRGNELRALADNPNRFDVNLYTAPTIPRNFESDRNRELVF